MAPKPVTTLPRPFFQKKGRQVRSLTVVRDGPNIPEPSRWVPWPRVSVMPILSAGMLSDGEGDGLAEGIPSVLEAGPALHLTSGRAALYHALAGYGIGPGDSVLLPAYHCTAMVEPVIKCGATPVFFRVNDDLTADLDDIARKADAHTRALVLPHYFGFPQGLGGVRGLCADRGIKLIEDCAHAFFGRLDGRPVGAYGDCAIASIWKFFPVIEGGTLISQDPALRAGQVRTPSRYQDIVEAGAALDEAIYYGRLGWLWPASRAAAAVRHAGRLIGRLVPRAAGGLSPAALRASDGADDAVWRYHTSRFTAAVTRRASHARIKKRRRAHYLQVLEALGDLPGVRPLHAVLPETVVPFMVPFWIERLDELFPRFEDAGVPTQRFGQFLWNGLDASVCPASDGWSHHGLQLPCHQELTPLEVDWMVETTRAIVAGRR